jgi:hypothetical protein
VREREREREREQYLREETLETEPSACMLLALLGKKRKRGKENKEGTVKAHMAHKALFRLC